jgi:hypothetical protein
MRVNAAAVAGCWVQVRAVDCRSPSKSPVGADLGSTWASRVSEATVAGMPESPGGRSTGLPKQPSPWRSAAVSARHTTLLSQPGPLSQVRVGGGERRGLVTSASASLRLQQRSAGASASRRR